MSDKALITPSVIQWARETARFSLVEAAKKLGVKPAILLSWETNEASPTMNQALKMSRVYRRSLSVFFLPEPPKDFQTLRDFRRTDHAREYSPALTFILREVQFRQNWIKEVLHEEEEDPLPFIGKFSVNDQVDVVASDIASTLQIKDDITSSDRLKYWIHKVESKRIFVSLGSNIHSRMVFDVDEFRGFAVSDPMCPFIFINTKDARQAQLFTLVHELVHLWINASGVSREIAPAFRETESDVLDPVEVFCNRVSAKLLMPDDWFNEVFPSGSKISLEVIDDAAKQLQLSSKAVIVYLLNSGKIVRQVFYSFWNRIDNRNEALRSRFSETPVEKKGFADPNLMKVRKCGYSLSNIILGSYKSGRISPLEASSLLDVKVNNFSKLERFL
ncbi:MAG: XRE family transcriptional regulator [Balneolales bacterium]